MMRMRIAKKLLVGSLAVLLALGTVNLQMPKSAFASVKRGTMEIEMDSSVSLEKGSAAAVNCTITPMSERQRPCCSTDYCPSGCEAGGVKGCLDRDGFCTCLGGDYYTANASASVASSAPSIARAKWLNGVLTVKGYAPGTATISVTAKMTLWIAKTQTLSVTVNPKPSEPDDGEDRTSESGSEASGSDGSKPGEDSDASGSASGSSQAGSSSKKASTGGSAEKRSTGSASGSSQARSSSKRASSGGTAEKKSTGSTSSTSGKGKSSSSNKKKSSIGANNSSSKKTSSVQRTTSSGVTVGTPSASRGTAGSAEVTITAKDTDKSKTNDEISEDAEDMSEDIDEESESIAEQAQAQPLDTAKAASAVSYVDTEAKHPVANTLVWTAVLTALVLAAAGSWARYRAWKKQHAAIAAADDDDAQSDEEV